MRLPAPSPHRPARPAQPAHLLVQGVEEDDGLHRLAQPHLVGQDCVGALGPGEAQPVEALQLVWVKCAARGVNIPGLLVKLDCGLQGRQRFRHTLSPGPPEPTLSLRTHSWK